VSDHVDFNEEIKEIEEPMCVANFGASAAMFDHLPSIANKEKLMYTGEEVLKEVSCIIKFCFSGPYHLTSWEILTGWIITFTIEAYAIVDISEYNSTARAKNSRSKHPGFRT